MARRISLFEREVSVKLAPIAIGLLHDAARILHEGELTGDVYAGSTMLTVDLAKTKHVISDPADATTAQRVAFLYASDEKCREFARRIAVAEARRASGFALGGSHVDVESRAKGAELHLSLNVEARRIP
ncbi:MAG TPA: hypothetical protein VGC41_03795 [Kofleriaceae bacterium]